MKKLIIIPFLFLALLAQGQNSLIIGVNSSSNLSVDPYCAEYRIVYNAMPTKPSASVATAQNAMVSSLVTGGYFARMADLIVAATEYEDGALINWKSPGTYNADNVHTTAWTSLEGYTGDGVNDYISTNFIGSADSAIYKKNSAGVGVYLRLNVASTTENAFGVSDGTRRTSLLPRNTSDFFCQE